MDNKDHNTVFLETLAMVLIRSFFVGVVFLILWFLLFLVGADWMYRVHPKWFDITKHDFHLINYYGMAFVKISIFLFFLFPYLSIRLILRK